MSKRAFTLIELLVVIAIIAILAAILFPVFAQAKQAAKKTADITQMKQISTAIQIYLGDNDDIFPMLRNGVTDWGCVNNTYGSAGGGPGLQCHQVNATHVMIKPYVKNTQIWKAPVDTMPRCDDDTTGFGGVGTQGPISYVLTRYAPSTGTTVNYGIAGWGSGSGTPTDPTSLSSSAIGNVSGTIALVPSMISWSYFTGFSQHRADLREYAFEPQPGFTNGLPTWPNVTRLNAWCGGDTMSLAAYGNMSIWGMADSSAKAMNRSRTMDSRWRTDIIGARDNFAKNMFHYDERYKN